ncbi:MAG: translation initiation factor IF-2, partial [Candidatus Bathyarchaeia archaeon]
IYTVMGTFSRLGFRAERFDEVTDFAKTVSIVPLSAKTGEGIPELLTVLIGLTQQYMQKELMVTAGQAKGTVLEVREELGLGITLNAIIYDGVLRRGDTIVVGGREKPMVTKVRAILLPKPLDEMRDPRDKFTPVERVSAAAGVKIAAPLIEDALAGGPILAATQDQPVEELVALVSEEVGRIRFSTDRYGVVLKTDTLGSLEAIVGQLDGGGVPIRLADVGNISRRDVVEASVVRAEAPLRGVVLGFGVKVLPDAGEEAKARGVPVFLNDVIYRLIEDYEGWVRREREAMVREALEALVRPGKVRVLPGFVFRESKPAIFGVEVLAGRIRPKYPMAKTDGSVVGEIAQIQDRGETISEATAMMRVAVSMREPTVGRHFDEGETLYVAVPESHVKELMKRYESYLSPEEAETLNELIEIMRRSRPLWGL